jgi:hypothetical protein
MAAPVLVAGQGLAGTLLAWALERAGRDFLIYDPGHAEAASRVGAGLVNPVTGERWAATPGWADKSAAACEVYRGIERAWGVALLSDLRVRREWRSEAEGELVRAKVLRGDLEPWVRAEGLEAGAAWIEGAWRVDLPALIAAGRERWRAQGRLRGERLEAGVAGGVVVWCIGSADTRVPELRAVGGETLEIEVGLEPGVVRHDGVWVLPVGEGRAWAGASFVRDEAEREARREELRASVRRQLAGVAWRETAVLAGRRMTSPDRVPTSGWLPGRERREGVFNGLGSKGALLAPGLADDWVGRLSGGVGAR